MGSPDVVVVDYGVGNLLSVQRALEACGGRVVVSGDYDVVSRASRVVLPGVGAFGRAIEELKLCGLDVAIREFVATGQPLLGICLGMQMFFDGSEEFGTTEGLSLIPGRVTRIPSQDAEGRAQAIPHMGWSELMAARPGGSWSGTVLEGTSTGSAFYFVHSYMAVPYRKEHVVAICTYGGAGIAAVVRAENVVGCQFHPEKSGEPGLTVLRRFLSQ